MDTDEEDRVMFEFNGGPLDGTQVRVSEWPADKSWPGTEVLDKASGSLYRYNARESKRHAVYTYRLKESAHFES